MVPRRGMQEHVRGGVILVMLVAEVVGFTMTSFDGDKQATNASTSPSSWRQSRRRETSSSGFLDCLSAVRGRQSPGRLLSDLDSDDSRDSFLGRMMSCVKVPILRGLREVRQSHGGELEFWGGAVTLHPTGDGPVDEGAMTGAQHPDDVERARALGSDDEEILAFHDIIVELDRVSRGYALDVEVHPGVRATLLRDKDNEEAVNLRFKLDGLAEVAKRQFTDEDPSVDVDDVEIDDVEDGDERQHGRDLAEDEVEAEERKGHKKKKVLKGLKKLRKKLAPYLPLLAIPLAIQLLLLPLYIIALKIMALKSILLGKMTLLLVAFNILRNAQQRQIEDDHNSRVAAEYYGYSDEGIEYGGWVNRRRAFEARASRSSRSGSGTARTGSGSGSGRSALRRRR